MRELCRDVRGDWLAHHRPSGPGRQGRQWLHRRDRCGQVQGQTLTEPVRLRRAGKTLTTVMRRAKSLTLLQTCRHLSIACPPCARPRENPSRKTDAPGVIPGSSFVPLGRGRAADPLRVDGASRGGASKNDYSLISGPAAASNCDLVRGLSKPSFGVGLLPISKSMAAAWRASTCTIEPASASTCLLFSDGPAPL